MRIPTNIITGFLGVGKTTAILNLLANKPSSERWAVLVNEYGEVSIDEAILAGAGHDGVHVREVAGGCVCCVAAPYLGVALHLLLSEAQPQRLIVETTGLGHPAQLIDRFRNQYADRLELRSTLTIVSPDYFRTPGMLSNPVFHEQIELADVLVLNKHDRADATTLQDFQSWANQLIPQKLLIAATDHGYLNPAWLDLKRSPLPCLTADDWLVGTAELPASADPPLLGQPIRHPSPGEPPSCGWRFHPEQQFDDERFIQTMLGWTAVSRAKAIVRVGEEWFVLNRVGQTVTVQPTQYRGESRVQVFSTRHDEWDAIEHDLVACYAGANRS